MESPSVFSFPHGKRHTKQHDIVKLYLISGPSEGQTVSEALNINTYAQS